MNISSRINRNLVVTRLPAGVLVSFFWHDLREQKTFDRWSRHLHFLDGVVLESVEKAIGVIMRDGSLTYSREGVSIEEWRNFDQNPDLFDLIVDAEEPEQAFISRYVLEG